MAIVQAYISDHRQFTFHTLEAYSHNNAYRNIPHIAVRITQLRRKL